MSQMLERTQMDGCSGCLNKITNSWVSSQRIIYIYISIHIIFNLDIFFIEGVVVGTNSILYFFNGIIKLSIFILFYFILIMKPVSARSGFGQKKREMKEKGFTRSNKAQKVPLRTTRGTDPPYQVRGRNVKSYPPLFFFNI